MEEISSIRTGYDRWATIYDHDRNPLIALEEPRIRDMVGGVRGLAVLDVGCGTGRHSSWLAANGANVTAIDFSEGMLAQARRKPASDLIRFIVHDLAEPLPFADQSFDLAISGLVLEHIHNLGIFFGEIHRVVRTGARAVISAMHPAMFLRGSQARFTDPESGLVVLPGSINHPLGHIVTAAVQAGFSLRTVDEFAPDSSLVELCPRAEKYLGWPMLVLMDLVRLKSVGGLT